MNWSQGCNIGFALSKVANAAAGKRSFIKAEHVTAWPLKLHGRWRDSSVEILVSEDEACGRTSGIGRNNFKKATCKRKSNAAGM